MPTSRRDLETICLKCLEKDPRRRYASAHELAADLNNWLDSRPITARRVGSTERAWLWCKRNPWLAGAAGSTAAAIVAVAVISTVFAVEQTRAKNRITGLAVNLRSSLDESQRLGGELKTSLNESYTRLARLDFERAGNAFEKGQTGPGLLRLVQSWRSAIAAGDPGWQHTARAALSGWQRQLVEPRSILFHEEAVVAIAFSPDGKTILTGSADNTARLWDAATGQPIGLPMQHQGHVSAVAFSPDGRAVVTGSEDKTARLWDAATGRPIAPTLRHEMAVTCVAFSPDGKTVLTGSRDWTARLWDAATGQPIGSPMPHQGFVYAAAFSPDGKIVLTGGWQDKSARLWDATTGQPIGTPMSHQGGVQDVAFSPDGKSVLTGIYRTASSTARLWDVATGQPIGNPMPHEQGVLAVAFSPDGKFVLTGSEDKTARLWDAATGQAIGTPMAHRGPVRHAVAFSPDGRIVLTGSGDNTARLWDVATGRPLGPPMEHSGPVLSVAFSPDGRSVLTGSSDTARLWDVTELPDEPERVAAWIETATGIRVEEKDEFEILDRKALSESRQRLAKMGGSPIRKQRWSLDPILFGSEPAARARARIERGRWAEAKAAFDEALAARPLYAPLWAERARFHTAHGRRDQAVLDAAQAVLRCWNDPKLAALARSDEGFRDEAMSEILQLKRSSFREAQEVWYGRGRRRASQWDCAAQSASSRSQPCRYLQRDFMLIWVTPVCSD